MDDISNASTEREIEAIDELDSELATSADYTHTFSAPFEWMGTTYKQLDFNFGKLKGKDSLAIYRELQMSGILVLNSRSSQEYQLRLASKACGLGIDAFKEMPFRDFEAVLSKARNFIPAAALL